MSAPRALIAEAVNLVVFLAGRGRARHVQQIARIVGHDQSGYRLDAIDTDHSLPSTSGDQL
jgi:type IV secretion system protein VirB11